MEVPIMGMFYEVVSKQAQFIWGCSSLKHARKQLKYVKKELGYPDAYIHAYRGEAVPNEKQS